jgi:riboflavin synthase
MFTGLVQAVGRIANMRAAAQTAAVAIDAGGLDLADVAIGDSIACNGVCLTVTRLTSSGFSVDVSEETLRVSTGFEPGAAVNLEKSLRLADRLDGHLVSGHVDGIGIAGSLKDVEGNRELTVLFPAELARYFARKGSVTVNGVSLTINSVDGGSFAVNLIPHTLSATNLGELRKGGRVNLEVDLVARYVERILGMSK